jgi:very-short-patch-repair endonuclease
VGDSVVDGRISRIAAAQDGVIGRAQLLDAGLARTALDHRVRTGRLTVVFRGVYAPVRAALTPRGWGRAALLAVGPDAVLSHRSAAYVWGLLDPPPEVHVTVQRHLRSRPRLVVHTAPLPAHEVRRYDGYRVTSPLRTLEDLHRDPDLTVALREARIARLVSDQQVRNTPKLARVADARDAQPTRSELERAMLDLIERAGLPQPLTNHRIGAHTVDFAWPAHRLIVETDGYSTHGDRAAFERDRARDADLAAHGWTVLRFTHTQVTTQPLRVAARLAQALLTRAPGPPG